CTLLFHIQFMCQRRVARIEGILRRIQRLLPALKQAVPQHTLDPRSRTIRKFQELRERKRATLRLQQHSNLFFFFGERVGPFTSSRRTLPCDHALRFALFVLNALSNFDETEALQSLQCWYVETQLCFWP